MVSKNTLRARVYPLVWRPTDARPTAMSPGTMRDPSRIFSRSTTPDDRAGDVVIAGSVEARHLGRLAAEKRRAVLAARPRDALDDALDQARLDFSRGDVVQEEERPRALHQDVVHAVVHEIGAARVVAGHLDRHLELGPDAVGGGHEDRLAVVREVRAKEAAEAADVAEHARREGRADGGPGASQGGRLRVDVDAGFGVAGVFQGQRIIAKRGRRATESASARFQDECLDGLDAAGKAAHGASSRTGARSPPSARAACDA